MRILLLFVLGALLACNPDRNTVLDTRWVVVSYQLTETDSVRNAPQPYVLSFDDSRSFSFQLDVNTCGGSVNLQANNIILFTQTPTCTEACCDGAYARGVLTALKEVNRYELLNEQLIFTGNGGLRVVWVKE